jgi:hypothetical protein
MGCRPVAVKRGDGFATTVISSEQELDRLFGAAVQRRAARVLEEVARHRRRAFGCPWACTRSPTRTADAVG